jgi:hypothetical protein
MSASLLLSSCGKKNDETINNKQTETSSNASVSVSVNNKNSTNEENDLIENEGLNSSKSPDKETLNNLIENSDYISRVRVQMDPDNNASYTFIEDYKGDLSSIEVELPDNLLANREYIIFYLDGSNGKIMPTREDQSFVEIQSTNDASLKYVENLFKKDSVPNLKDEKSDENMSSELKSDSSSKKKSSSSKSSKSDTSKSSKKTTNSDKN